MASSKLSPEEQIKKLIEKAKSSKGIGEKDALKLLSKFKAALDGQTLSEGSVKGKKTFWVSEFAPNYEKLEEAILNKAAALKAEGGTLKAFSKIGTEDDRINTVSILDKLIADKKVFRKEGKIPKYYLAGYEPADAISLAKKQILNTITPSDIWLEKVLLGTKTQASIRKSIIDDLVRSGKLRRLYVVISSTKKEPALQLIASESGSTDLPNWSIIEAAIRRLAEQRIDHAVSFEDLAEALGITVFATKTALVQAQGLGKPIRWVEGEDKLIKDPRTSSIELNGRRFYRFKFQG